MAMPVTVPPYTVDDLDTFPDDGNRYELLDGALLVSPAPHPPHELVVQRLRDALVAYLTPAARVFTRGAVRVGRRNHLEPDLLVLPSSVRLAKRWSKVSGFWLAVEVSGRGSRAHDRDFKHTAYQRLGVPESWRADLRDHSIDVLRPGANEAVTIRDCLSWQPPGFDRPVVLDLPTVFADIDGDD